MDKKQPQMQANPAQETPMPQEKKEKKLDFKSSWLFWVTLIAALLLIGGAVYYYFFYKEKQDTGNGADQTTPGSTETSTTSDDDATDQDTYAGPKIAYVKGNGQDDSILEIWTVAFDGTHSTNTGHEIESGSHDYSFKQSPDYKYVCIRNGTLEEGEEQYLLDIENNTFTQISDSYFAATDDYDGSWIQACVWASDSSKFAYMVSHHPQESTEGGGLPEKDDPPAEFDEKMGGFVYDISSGELTRVTEEYEFSSDSEWLPTGEWETYWSLINGSVTCNGKTFSYSQEETGGMDYDLVVEANGTESTVYTFEDMHASPSPIVESPDCKHIVAAKDNGHMVVISVADTEEIDTYSDARVDGYWTKFEWLSNDKIMFWQSQNGHDYDETGGDWHQGNLMVLDISDGSVSNITTGNTTFSRTN